MNIVNILEKGTHLGSIAGGGRYDGLIGMFGKKPIPSVGFSLGMERIFVLLEKKKANCIRESATDVFVASIDKEMLEMRMEICALLWKAKIKRRVDVEGESTY